MKTTSGRLDRERREHLHADAALAQNVTPLLLPRVASELIAEFSRSLANAGLLHPLEAEAIRRAIGAERG